VVAVVVVPGGEGLAGELGEAELRPTNNNQAEWVE